MNHASLRKHFANIKRAVLRAARSIPAGRVSTATDIAQAFDIPARHAACILSQLRPDRRVMVPVHRGMSKNGTFPRPDKRTDAHRPAIGLLARESIERDSPGRVDGFPSRRMIWSDTWADTIWAKETDSPERWLSRRISVNHLEKRVVL